MQQKRNLKKIRPPGRKRKLFATMGLSLILLLSRARYNYPKSLNPDFDNNYRHVILAKAGSNPINTTTNLGPSNFPTPSSGGRPSWPVYVPKTRIAPRVMDPGAGANPAGAGGGGAAAEFDENFPVPNKEESKTFDYDHPSPKKKKQSEDQCPIDQPKVNESFKFNSSLKKVTKRALVNQDVKREYERIQKRIGEGVDPMDIGRGSTDLGEGLTYVRGQHGRYIVKNDNGVKDVVGIAYRGSRNDMKTLAKEMNKLYNVNIEPGGY
jgi:hypothetical protein